MSSSAVRFVSKFEELSKASSSEVLVSALEVWGGTEVCEVCEVCKVISGEVWES